MVEQKIKVTDPDIKPISILRTGSGSLPRLDLTAHDGARAEIYLHGAHITSWIPAGGEERLFLSQASQFRPGTPIRGGVPVVFPQFGTSGPLPPHGLARIMPWEFVNAQPREDGAAALFRLRDTAESRRLWPHAFRAALTVTIGGSRIEISLEVTNTGAEPFSFTAAFHPYFSVSDISQAYLEGLGGLRYHDAAIGGVDRVEESDLITFSAEVNRVYFAAPTETRLGEANRFLKISKTGFTDTVVWYPAAEKCAPMADLEPDDFRRFICVEAATLGVPITLTPGEIWEGKQTLASY